MTTTCFAFDLIIGFAFIDTLLFFSTVGIAFFALRATDFGYFVNAVFASVSKTN